MSIWPNRIFRPRDTLSGVSNPDQYEQLQRAIIANNRAKLPNLQWRDPWLALTVAVPYINWSRWMVKCECGDCPLFDPEWKIARCFECGAVYQMFDLPSDSEMAAIERALSLRPELRQRNWRLPGHPEETIEQLVADNVAHGDPVPPDREL